MAIHQTTNIQDRALTGRKATLSPENGLSFLLLAPADRMSCSWNSSQVDKRRYDETLRATQRFRANIYIKDSAIDEKQLDGQGGFRMRGDESSWHILLVDQAQKITGCVRILAHKNSIEFDDLILRHSALVHDRHSGSKVRHAFETEIRIARNEGTPYVEIGGWALAEERRGTRAALKILLASYAWGRLIGGCRGACTATARHGSSSILRRIGGTPLEYFGETLPAYYDPAYGCQMEILRFESRSLNPRFSPFVGEVEDELASSPVITTKRVKSVAKHEMSGVLVA